MEENIARNQHFYSQFHDRYINSFTIIVYLSRHILHDVGNERRKGRLFCVISATIISADVGGAV